MPNITWPLNTFKHRRCKGKNVSSKDILKLIKLMWIQLHCRFQAQGEKSGIIVFISLKSYFTIIFILVGVFIPSPFPWDQNCYLLGVLFCFSISNRLDIDRNFHKKQNKYLDTESVSNMLPLYPFAVKIHPSLLIQLSIRVVPKLPVSSCLPEFTSFILVVFYNNV